MNAHPTHPSATSGPVILCLETATPVMGVALIRGALPLASLSLVPSGGHSRHLMAAVDWLVRAAGLPSTSWSAVAVSRGPGSFTGLRIGLATAKALAMGLRIPLHGVSTLQALASRAPARPGEPVCAVLDARKGQVFAGLFLAGEGGPVPAGPPVAVPPEHLPRHVTPGALFLGDGLARYGPEIDRAFGRPVLRAPGHLWYPDPVAVGLLGLKSHLAGEPDQVVSLVPDYVRASDAELSHPPA
jgi:tRNA threonylcarbamoyladenosine biosynthesis protein TsaB